MPPICHMLRNQAQAIPLPDLARKSSPASTGGTCCAANAPCGCVMGASHSCRRVHRPTVEVRDAGPWKRPRVNSAPLQHGIPIARFGVFRKRRRKTSRRAQAVPLTLRFLEAATPAGFSEVTEL